MPLELLNIYNARNLKELTFKPIPTYNIIYGKNGSGKTTILESIYFLLRTRIFRNNKYKSFINIDSLDCTIFSKFVSSSTNHTSNSLSSSDSFSLGISRKKNSSLPLIHLNQSKVTSLSQISNLVLLGLITPESFLLLDAGPNIRRKFLDWGVFHVEPTFLNLWKSYNKILNNRNNVLKQFKSHYITLDNIPNNQFNNLDCWSPQLINLNNQLNNFRLNQYDAIKGNFFEFLNVFSSDLSKQINIKFYQGWSSSITYDEYIKNKSEYDFNSSYTRYGTHRSDIIINYNEHLAKDTLSRGQKKIVVICLILAQFIFLNSFNNKHQHSILLLDDMDSELDQANLVLLFSILNKYFDSQVILTTTDKNKYKFIESEYKLFHVEHE